SLSLFGYCTEFPTPRTNSWRESFDCCSWEGVTCDKVIGHNHDFNMLSSNLTSLRDLHHDSVNMSSVTPMSLLNLSSYLTSLSPTFCGISGEIPDSFPVSNWSSPLIHWSLEIMVSRILDLGYNKLTGPIEHDQIQLHNAVLQSFVLKNNDVMVLPSYFFELENLSYLDLSSNNLSGTVESNTLAKLEKLGYLELSNNRFLSLSGSDSDINYTIPMLTSFLFFFSSCNARKFPNFLRTTESLYNFYLSNNKIEGPLLVPPPLVHVLDLSRNSLGKTIPECLGNLNRFLMFLQLHMNNFHGLVTRRLVQKFQREMEMMQLLSIFIAMGFSENLFYGHIPKELGALCSLQVLNLSHNHFNGPIPPSYSRIYQN
ncbi:hypothetical protein E1A91_D03G181100v1, partial [Gossypium mustelinum]